MVISKSVSYKEDLVFIIPDLNSGGGERVTTQIIEELGRRGRSIRLITKSTRGTRVPDIVTSFREIEWLQPLNRVITILTELNRSQKDSVIVVVLTGPIIITGILNVFFRRNLFAIDHSDLEKLYLQGPKLKVAFRKVMLGLAYKNIKRVAFVSEYLSQRFPELIKFRKKDTFVIRNPVFSFTQKIKCAFIKTSICVGLTAYVIGRFAPEKRIPEAIKLLSECNHVEKIVLVSHVENSSKNALLRISTDKLVIVDDYNGLEFFDPGKSFLLNYSFVESYSLVVGEWLASGLPIITVDTEPMRRLWSKWRNVYFCPVHSKSSNIEECLNTMLSNKCDYRSNFKEISITETVDDFEKFIR